MISRVIVHLRERIFYVESYDRTTKKVWLAGGEPVALRAQRSPDSLGQAVRDAMEQSEVDVTRSGRSDLTVPLLKLAGVAAYKTYIRGLKTVGVNATDASGDLVITVRPTFNDGEGHARYDAEAVQTFTYDSAGQLEAALLRAFEVATPT